MEIVLSAQRAPFRIIFGMYLESLQIILESIRRLFIPSWTRKANGCREKKKMEQAELEGGVKGERTEEEWRKRHYAKLYRKFIGIYVKRPDGSWSTWGSKDTEGDDFPPDLNAIIDPLVSDEELRSYLELPSSCSADTGGLA